MWDMIHWIVRHDSLIRETWLCPVWHASFICVTWRIRMCGMTHSYVWHDSFIYVTWLSHMCDMTLPFRSFVPSLTYSHMTHSHIWNVVFICLIHQRDTTHSMNDRFRYDALTLVKCRICVISTSDIQWMSVVGMSDLDMTHSLMWNEREIHVKWNVTSCEMKSEFTHVKCRTHIWLTHTYEMWYSYVSFISATRLIQWMSDLDMTHSLLWNAVLRYDSLTHMKCPIYIWLTHTNETLCSYVCVACLIYFWDMWFMHRCDTHYQ